MERFAVTIEQPYAAASVEKKIVLGSMKKYGTVDEDFATNLVTWSEVIRKTFYDGGVDELISTRRLDHIVKAFAIFKDKMKSIEMYALQGLMMTLKSLSWTYTPRLMLV